MSELIRQARQLYSQLTVAEKKILQDRGILHEHLQCLVPPPQVLSTFGSPAETIQHYDAYVGRLTSLGLLDGRRVTLLGWVVDRLGG